MKAAGLLDQKATRAGSNIEIPVLLEARPAQSFSWGKWVQSKIVIEQSGKINTPALGAWDLTKLIENTDVISGKIDDAVLGHRSPIRSMQAVIWLQEPISESRLSEITPNSAHLDLVFLSPGLKGRKPIGWDAQEDCTLRGMEVCQSDRTLTGQFRQWTSMLEGVDEQILKWLGLNLSELQLRATEGKIYGAVLTLPPADLIDIQSRPEVAWAQIIGMRM
ncbi:hypothetical protein Psi01_67200 [Planobispora siamensis]|uniref:Uncharacterized protein n=2 Tax=Planobispora siamensis TaxID=936338 RepID=A0A8J3SMS7_9ACTN|nr:hypothetical protein Psi01_67200 [Planobispora siamensis]